MNNNRVIFIGLSTVDHTYLLEDFPSENTKIFSKNYLFQCGGPALNAAITNNILGGTSQLITCFGNSSLAAQAMEFMKENFSVTIHDIIEGINYTFPASSVMINPQSGSRTIINPPKATESLNLDYSETRLADSSIVLLDGHYLHPALRYKIIEARSSGVKIVMDGGSWKPDTDNYLDLIDYIICSTNFKKPGFNQKETVAYLHNAGIDFVGITDNENPILVSTRGNEEYIPVEQIDAVDTLGAGDVLHGAFCYYLSQGNDGKTALGNAARVATDSCRYFGTQFWHKDYR
jgi:sugar/nucleoside kinase (ribokinase family)